MSIINIYIYIYINTFTGSTIDTIFILYKLQLDTLVKYEIEYILIFIKFQTNNSWLGISYDAPNLGGNGLLNYCNTFQFKIIGYFWSIIMSYSLFSYTIMNDRFQFYYNLINTIHHYVRGLSMMLLHFWSTV